MRSSSPHRARRGRTWTRVRLSPRARPKSPSSLCVSTSRIPSTLSWFPGIGRSAQHVVGPRAAPEQGRRHAAPDSPLERSSLVLGGEPAPAPNRSSTRGLDGRGRARRRSAEESRGDGTACRPGPREKEARHPAETASSCRAFRPDLEAAANAETEAEVVANEQPTARVPEESTPRSSADDEASASRPPRGAGLALMALCFDADPRHPCLPHTGRDSILAADRAPHRTPRPRTVGALGPLAARFPAACSASRYRDDLARMVPEDACSSLLSRSTGNPRTITHRRERS